MENEHVMSEEVMDEIQRALSKNEYWMAYNSVRYFLGKDDVCFFDSGDEAEEFARNNISDHDSFRVIKVTSLEDALRQIPYGKALDNYLSSKEGEHLQQLSDTHLNTNKNFIMNDKNYEYLSEQLKRTGFGDTLNDDLRKQMQTQNAEFTLNLHKTYGNDNVSATLHFKRSNESDMYFFNRYDLELKKQNNENAIQQTFYPNRGIILKEGY
jgi:hypothetical protein